MDKKKNFTLNAIDDDALDNVVGGAGRINTQIPRGGRAILCSKCGGRIIGSPNYDASGAMLCKQCYAELNR